MQVTGKPRLESSGTGHRATRAGSGRGVRPGLRADPDLIRAVLDNLPGNAWKYTAGRPDPVIDFGAAAVPGRPVTYFVAGNGAGFDPAYSGKLFQPFQRLHGGRIP